MYVPSAFKIDRAACLAFAAARGFGTVMGHDGTRPHGASLPFNLTYAADGTRAPTPMCRRSGTSALIRCRRGFMNPSSSPAG